MLDSNADLLQFMDGLASDLRSLDEPQLATEVERAIMFGSGSPSEFLHEAKLALVQVHKSNCNLPSARLQDVSDAIEKIDAAFNAVGGA